MKWFKGKSAAGDSEEATPAHAATPSPDDAPEAPVGAVEAQEKDSTASLFSRLKRGLGRTSDNLVAGLGTLFLGRKTIDDELLEELETQLLMADVGIEATRDIIDASRRACRAASSPTPRR
jgi:fused signal recognition particle receptor